MLGTPRASSANTLPGSPAPHLLPFSCLLSETGRALDEVASVEYYSHRSQAGAGDAGVVAENANEPCQDCGDTPEVADLAQDCDMQKAIISDPRKKLLTRLNQVGLLSGEKNRKRQERDLKDYPDIAALAHVAKTKEAFYEIIGSPKSAILADPERNPRPAVGDLTKRDTLFGEQDRIHEVLEKVSPTSTRAGADSLGSGDSQGSNEASPEWLPQNYGEMPAFDLNTATDDDAFTPPPLPCSMTRQTKSPPDIGCSPRRMAPRMDRSRCVGPERADLLWKLAGRGSPQLKPLDSPEAETDGSTKTGVYLLSSPKAGPCDAPSLPFQGIFKPLDEEIFERRGIEIGMGALREEAAFVIDRASGGLAHVPVTARASVESKKGSIQQFVEESVGPVEDFGMPRELSAAEAVVGLDNAQAVACFDICIFNTDRHSGNLLLAGPRPHKIVCIDHGCVLPAWWALESCSFEAWLDWPHVRAPPSPATLSLVAQVTESLPTVVQELEKLGLPTQAIWTLEICTALLQKCVLFHGFTLRSVALLMTRGDPAEPSWLERTVAEACASAGVTAEFKPEGKYGDLMLEVDHKILNWFLAPEGALSDARHLSNFRDAFFIFLNSAFAHTDVIRAVQVAEEAVRRPWD